MQHSSCNSHSSQPLTFLDNINTISLGSEEHLLSLVLSIYQSISVSLSLSNYYCGEQMQAMYKIGTGEPPPVAASLSPDSRDFILQCLQVNPNDRPTAAVLLNHPFVKRPLPTSSGSASHIKLAGGFMLPDQLNRWEVNMVCTILKNDSCSEKWNY